MKAFLLPDPSFPRALLGTMTQQKGLFYKIKTICSKKIAFWPERGTSRAGETTVAVPSGERENIILSFNKALFSHSFSCLFLIIRSVYPGFEGTQPSVLRNQ